jgi:hypothetical protein
MANNNKIFTVADELITLRNKLAFQKMGKGDVPLKRAIVGSVVEQIFRQIFGSR